MKRGPSRKWADEEYSHWLFDFLAGYKEPLKIIRKQNWPCFYIFGELIAYYRHKKKLHVDYKLSSKNLKPFCKIFSSDINKFAIYILMGLSVTDSLLSV